MLSLLRRLTGAAKAETRARGVVLRPRDCHTHVIPGVDDGARTMEESLQMLRLLHRAGARTVIATSHIYPGRFDNEPDELRRRFEELEAARRHAEIPVELELGAEHYLDETLLDRVRAGNVVAFGAERYVLFETATGEHVPTPLLDVVYALGDGGYTPLMAHVERYRWLRDDDELCEDLRAAGVKFQVNRTVGKSNLPGKGSRGEFIAKLIDRDWIDEVGSDLHRATQEGRPYAIP
jgi:tyrosine-protein phosphatase YwqE